MGATCNHVAALLFKLNYAWEQEFTNKACTDQEAAWKAPPSSKKKTIEPKTINDMQWRKPHFRAKSKVKVINTVTRKQFSPSVNRDTKPSLEGLMNALYVSSSNACVFQYASPTFKPSYAADDVINVEEI